MVAMPNIRSAEKALRQSRRRRKKNLAQQKTLKSVLKEYKKLIEAKSPESAAKLALVYQALDKAAKTRLIAPNKAARLKSRLAKKLGV